MDKEQQLAEARKLLKKFRAKNSLKKSPQNMSSRTASKENSSDISPPLVQTSLPLNIPVSLSNGVPELGQAMIDSSAPNQVPVLDSLQPLNSTPNQNSVASNSSLPAILNTDRKGSPNVPLLNGSIADGLAPSPIPKLNHSGVSYRDGLAAPGSTPLSQTSGEKAAPYSRDKRDARYEQLNYGMPEVGNWTASEERLKENERQKDGLGGGTDEVFSGASRGGVLIKHMPYLPSLSPNISPESLSRGGGGGGGGVGDRYRAGRVATHESQVGRYAAEEEIMELEQRVKVHAQTIDILVSEKSSLQSELSNYKSQLANKSRESMDMDIRLKSTERKVCKLEGEAAAVSSDLDKKSRDLEVAKGVKAELQRSLDRLRASLEDQREEGTELVSKVTAQSAEIVRLQEANADLQSKLGMTELLLSQQQSGNKAVEVVPRVDHSLSLRLQETEGRLEQLQQDLNHVVRQRDQANLDLSTLQEAMTQQREESLRKLSDSQKELSEYRNQVLELKKEVDELSIDKQVLEKKLSTEHAQTEHSFQSAMETLKEEKDQLTKQLENKIEENVDLVKKNTEAENSALEVTIKLSRLEEQSVDHENLMRTMTQDKEALSRAMSQNKELKANTVELQEAYVRLSNQNMELATQLDTERRRLAHLTALQATPTSSLATPTTPQTVPPSTVVSVASLDEAAPTTSPSVVTSGSSTSPAGGTRVGEKVDGWVQIDPVVEDAMDAGGPVSPSIAELQQYVQALERERLELLGQIESLHTSNQHLQSELSAAQSLLLQAGSNEHSPHQSPHEQPVSEEREEEEEEEEEEVMVEPQKTDQGHVTVNPAGPSRLGVQGSMSPLQLAELQSSFNALQMKFVTLMREKADLLDMLEEHKLLLITAVQQAEAMEDKDVRMYQKECEALRQQFLQKDAFIEKLRADKGAMQNNIGQLQVLMRRIIAEQKAKPHLSDSPTTVAVYSGPQPLPPASSALGPSHSSPAVSQTAVPAHLRPQLSNESFLPPDVSFESPSPRGLQTSLDISAAVSIIEDEDFGSLVDDSSLLTNVTAEQIMELLDKLDISGDTELSRNSEKGTGDLMMYCKTCTGHLQSV